MKNNRWIICFDFETDGTDPDSCNPVQLAAIPIHPETLEIKVDQSFDVIIKPDNIDKEEYFTTDVEKTIKWHADNYNTTAEEIVKRWKSGVSPKIAWKSFCNYCAQYNVEKRKGQWYPEPIPAGYNIVGFDIPIAKRLAKKYKTKLPFSSVTKLDMYDNIFWWFENLEEPNRHDLDTLRDFFGMKASGTAHDALCDVIDEAKIIVRFLRFHRKQASIDKFKGSFANG